LYNYTIQTDKNEVTPDEPMVQFWSESIPYSDYFWDFGDGQSAEGNNQNHTYTITRDGYYDVKLQVKNPNGCTEYATKRIWIATASLPNVFTPNGDGIDDIFMHGWHIQVYNRNGILLYDGTGGWDGTYKGSNVSNDTYFYVLYTPTVSGIKTRTGFVTVIR
jgi:gliding motility-associated-like protein